MPYSRSLLIYFIYSSVYIYRLPWWLSSWESACQCRRLRFDPWVRKIPWRRKWLPAPVFLPGKFHGQRNLEVCSPWGHRQSDTTERLSTHTHTQAVYIALPVFTGYVIFIIKLFFFWTINSGAMSGQHWEANAGYDFDQRPLTLPDWISTTRSSALLLWFKGIPIIPQFNL